MCAFSGEAKAVIDNFIQYKINYYCKHRWDSIMRLIITLFFLLGFVTGCSSGISKEDHYKNVNGNFNIYSFSIKGKELEANWDQSYYELTQKDANNIANKINSCYFRTNLIKPDYALTMKLLEEEALKGNENAQMDLGLIYVCNIYSDMAIESDAKIASEYFYPLAKKGFVDAQLKLAEFFLFSYISNNNIKAHDASQYWFKKLAEAENNTGLFGLALLKGVGKLQVENFKLAAEAGNPFAQLILAYQYITKPNDNQNDYSQAKFWLEKIDPKANMYESKLLLMAINYTGGYGIQSDKSKAIKYFKDLSQELLPKKVYQFISSLPEEKLIKIVDKLSNEWIEGFKVSGFRAEVRVQIMMTLINALKAVTDIKASYVIISMKEKSIK